MGLFWCHFIGQEDYIPELYQIWLDPAGQEKTECSTRPYYLYDLEMKAKVLIFFPGAVRHTPNPHE